MPHLLLDANSTPIAVRVTIDAPVAALHFLAHQPRLVQQVRYLASRDNPSSWYPGAFTTAQFDAVAAVITRCVNLRALQSDNWFLERVILVLDKVAATSEQASSAVIRWPLLSHLNLFWSPTQLDRDPLEILNSAPNVVSFTYHDMVVQSGLHFESMARIRKIDLVGDKGIRLLTETLPFYQRLEQISFAAYSRQEAHDLADLLLSTLTRLDLEMHLTSQTFWPNRLLVQALQNLPRLHTLTLTVLGGLYVTDTIAESNHLSEIILASPRLRTLRMKIPTLDNRLNILQPAMTRVLTDTRPVQQLRRLELLEPGSALADWYRDRV
ncbi:hypothetical protein BKA62DRAFT_726201 [Auriculariales sp. MPI-PUGE-AT-0066]|nr:hypothetical protein BKA62DRAFT_726201 [Auriculariales sp. MPI-PUGE-AT-0066]